jgi:hypothetical protein
MREIAKSHQNLGTTVDVSITFKNPLSVDQYKNFLRNNKFLVNKHNFITDENGYGEITLTNGKIYDLDFQNNLLNSNIKSTGITTIYGKVSYNNLHAILQDKSILIVDSFMDQKSSDLLNYYEYEGSFVYYELYDNWPVYKYLIDQNEL